MAFPLLNAARRNPKFSTLNGERLPPLWHLGVKKKSKGGKRKRKWGKLKANERKEKANGGKEKARGGEKKHRKIVKVP